MYLIQKFEKVQLRKLDLEGKFKDFIKKIDKSDSKEVFKQQTLEATKKCLAIQGQTSESLAELRFHCAVGMWNGTVYTP